MEFCKAFNAQTQGIEPGMPIPVVITAFADKSFTFVMKTPPATYLIKKAAAFNKGSPKPHTDKVGKLTRAQAEEIAKTQTAGSDRGRHGRGSAHDRRFRAFHGHHGGGSVMAKLSKRVKAIKAKVDRTKAYPFDNAVALIKECATAKFNESIDVSVQLGVDAEEIRPSGARFGRAACRHRQDAFASQCLLRATRPSRPRQPAPTSSAWKTWRSAIKAGDMPFDIVIASPDTMRIVGTLGQILGPRGLMPNPKVGTVTPDVATAVKNAKAGQVQYRTDKAGIIHATIGRKSF